MSAPSYTALPLVLHRPPVFRADNQGMAQTAPWIDAAQIDELVARYPTIARSRIELVLDAYWPVKNDVEAALLAIVARQQRDTTESLDYTVPVENAPAKPGQPPRL